MKTTTTQDLMAICRAMTRRAAASPLDPLPEAEPAVIESADRPHALVAVVRSRRRRPLAVALADVYAIGRQHGLAAGKIRDVVEAILADTKKPKPAVARDLRRLREAEVLDAVTALVTQAASAK